MFTWASEYVSISNSFCWLITTFLHAQSHYTKQSRHWTHYSLFTLQVPLFQFSPYISMGMPSTTKNEKMPPPPAHAQISSKWSSFLHSPLCLDFTVAGRECLTLNLCADDSIPRCLNYACLFQICIACLHTIDKGKFTCCLRPHPAETDNSKHSSSSRIIFPGVHVYLRELAPSPQIWKARTFRAYVVCNSAWTDYRLPIIVHKFNL